MAENLPKRENEVCAHPIIKVTENLQKERLDSSDKDLQFEQLNNLYEQCLEACDSEEEAEKHFKDLVGEEKFALWKKLKSELSEQANSKDLQSCFAEALNEVAELYDLSGEFCDFSIELFARAIMKYKVFKTIRENEDLLWYDEEKGVYRENGEVVVKELCEQLWTNRKILEHFKPAKLKKLTTHFVNEVINTIKRRTYVSNSEFDKDPYIINVRNGLLDIRTGELKPHSPDYLSRIQINAEYNPDAKCPNIDKFISEIVPEKYRRLLYQIAAYCLIPDYRYQKAFMLVGSGDNGKSTYLDLLTIFLGEENVSHVSLQNLTDNRFAASQLMGKLANIYADIPSTRLYSTGLFKMLTGGDRLSGERKFRDPVPFRNRAKLIFSANELPHVEDRTWAFWKRWILIEFPYKFDGTERPRDNNILQKLTTKEELSGFLNKVLEELIHLLSNGFEVERTELAELWMRKSNSVYAFVKDRLERDVKSYVPKEELYEEYVEYCEMNNLNPVSKNTFGKQLPKEIPTRTARVLHKGERVWAWMGIKLKPKEEDLDQSDLDSKIIQVIGDEPFSAEDVMAKIPEADDEAIMDAIKRLMDKGKIAQVNSHTWIKV